MRTMMLVARLQKRFASLLALMGAMALMIAGSGEAVTIPSTAYRYVHDANGQLVAASDPSSDTAVFAWDPVGNLSSVVRSPTSSLRIIQLVQTRGAVGDPITVDGTGYSTTLTSNAVRVNGTAATVSAASARSLTFRIPAGATSGAVTVTVGGVTVTSAQTLTVGSSSAPRITAMSPAIATAGDIVTLTGTGFDTRATRDVVTVGTARADISSVTATSLQFKTPTGTGSGPVTVQTPQGTATGSDLYVPPGSMTRTAVGPTTRLTAGTARTITFSAPSRVGLVLLSGQAGQQIEFNYTNNTLAGMGFYLLDPTGTRTLLGGGGSTGASGFLDVVTLPSTGTYTLEIDPGTYTGSLRLTGYLFNDVAGTIVPSPSGATQALSLGTPGQNGRYRITGQAGHAVAVGWSSSTITAGSFDWVDPSGNIVGGGALNNGSGFLDQFVFPSTGNYTLVVNPYGTYTGSVSLRVYDATDSSGGTFTPATAGTTRTPSSTVPGANVRYTFGGTAGQQISLSWASSTFSSATVRWLGPDGTQISAAAVNIAGGFADAFSLPSTGIYTLIVDPDGAATGSVSLTAYDASDLIGTIAPSAAGDPRSLALATPGRNARLTFSATAGQRVSFAVPSAPSDGALYLYGPTGAIVDSNGYSASGGMVGPTTLSSTGTYTLIVDPIGSSTGTTVVAGYVVTDVTDTLSLTTAGTDKTAAITAPGQVTKYTVSGTAGQQATVAWRGAAFDQWSLMWRAPDGSDLTGTWAYAGDGFLNQVTFPTTGTYTLAVDPWSTATGTVSLTAYDATDLATTMTPSASGTAKSVSTSVPGQNARVTFSGTAGDTVSFVVNGAPSSGTLVLLDPTGAAVIGYGYGTTYGQLDATLTSTGTYTLLVDPDFQSTGTVSFTGYRNAGGARMARTAMAIKVKAPAVTGVFAASDVPDASVQLTASASRPAIGSDGHGVRQRRSAGERRLREARRAATLAAFLRGDRRPSPAMRRRGASHPTAMTAVKPLRLRHQPGFPGGGSRVTATGLWVPGPKSRRAWMSDLQGSTQGYTPLRSQAGVTGLTGRTLRVDGRPLAGVTVGLEGSPSTSTTDAEGRFLLRGAPAGPRTLVVDGHTAGNRRVRFGTFSIRVDLAAGQTIDLGYPVWMTQLDPLGDSRVASPTTRDEVLTTPRIPGLEVRLPRGTIIRGADGKVVHDLNITQVPVDKPPFPLPSFIGVPVYFTVQPGRAYLSKGAQIIYPNYTHLPAGQRVDFWNYDAHGRGWYIYGHGTVTKDARQVVPDPNVRVWEFTGAMISSSGSPPPVAPRTRGSDVVRPIVEEIVQGFSSTGANAIAGPIDLGTGLFVRRETDLTLPDILPVSVTRTYRQGDPNSYSFGLGTSAPWDMRLWSVHNYTDLELVLPDGGTVHFTRTSPGTGWADAIYTSANGSGDYEGATVTFNGGGWDLARRDGSVYVFGDVAGLQAIRDRWGNTVQFTHANGQAGNVTQVTSPNGLWVKLTYDASNRITQAKDNGGRTVAYTYDTSGRLGTATDPVGRVTTYGYNASDQMTSIRNGRNITIVQNTYDPNGRLASQTAPGPATHVYTYALDASGAVTRTTITDPIGHRETTTFDANGMPVQEIAADGTGLAQTTRMTRDPTTGQITRTTDPLGRQTDFGYDSHGNVATITKLAGTAQARTTTMSYDTRSLPLAATDPMGHRTTITRGAHGEVTAITDELGHAMTSTYRSDGQLATITTALGKTTTFGYSANILTSRTDALGRQTSFFVDSVGRVVQVTSPEGRRSSVEYDDDDEQSRITDPNGKSTDVVYDNAGNVTSVTDPSGHTSSFTYDSLDRPLTAADALTRSASAVYDDDGNLVQKTDRKGQITRYAYDALNRLSEVRYGVSGASAESTVSYTYDAANRVTQAVDSASGTYTQTYDDFDEMTSGVTPQGTVGYGYDADGRRTSMTMAGLAETDYAYDDANRLTSVTRGAQTASFAYDNGNELTGVTLPDGVVGTRAYDDAGQLSSITYKKGAATVGDLDYAYDNDGAQTAEWGSLARLTLPAALGSATYDNANEQTARGTATLSYDANGALTNDGTSSYSYNARGQLVSMSGGGTTASFAYDLLGRRVGKTVNGTTTSYVYDGENAIKETTGASTATMFNALGADAHFSRTTAGGTENYLADRLGTTVALADGAGAITTSYAYTPFGRSTASGATSTNPYQFTGREADATGLQYSRARYYSPDAARFISRDPAGSGGSGNNLYDYVGNDPVDAIDPMGLWPNWDGITLQSTAFFYGALNSLTGGWVGNIDSVPENLRGAYTAGEIGGDVGAAFVPGLGWVIVGSGAVRVFMHEFSADGVREVAKEATAEELGDLLKEIGPEYGPIFHALRRLSQWEDAWLKKQRRESPEPQSTPPHNDTPPTPTPTHHGPTPPPPGRPNSGNGCGIRIGSDACY